MKLKTLALAAAIGMTSIVGCASQPGPKDPGQILVDNAAEIRVGANIATAAFMMTLDENDQADFGRNAYSLADAIHRAIEGDSLKLSDVRQYAINMISTSDAKHKAQFGSLLAALTDLIEIKIKTFDSLDSGSREAATRSLLLSATEGVMQATVTYRQITK